MGGLQATMAVGEQQLGVVVRLPEPAQDTQGDLGQWHKPIPVAFGVAYVHPVTHGIDVGDLQGQVGAPRRYWPKSFTSNFVSSSRRSTWYSSTERIARSRLLLSVLAGGASSSARLRVAQRRRIAFARLCLRALDASDRVVRDRIGFAQVVVERSERG